MNKDNETVPRYQLNTYRYQIDSPGEYKNEYMTFQNSPRFYGIIGKYPRYIKEAYITVKIKKEGIKYPIKGLKEKEMYIFTRDTYDV